MKSRQKILFDEGERKSSPGEYFTKETIDTWLDHGSEQFRKPDVFEGHRFLVRAIWYGPAGVEGENATEVILDAESERFTVSEYVWAEADDMQKACFAVQTTAFSAGALARALADASKSLTKKLQVWQALAWAASLGVAQLAYWGGEDDCVDSLPRKGDGG